MSFNNAYEFPNIYIYRHKIKRDLLISENVQINTEHDTVFKRLYRKKIYILQENSPEKYATKTST